MQSYNSSELWDTGFVALALAESGRAAEFVTMARAAYRFIEENQILEDVDHRDRYFRDPSKGGWPFSNRAHGWPIVDCTALGLMAALMLEPHAQARIETTRLLDAVDLLLFGKTRTAAGAPMNDSGPAFGSRHSTPRTSSATSWSTARK